MLEAPAPRRLDQTWRPLFDDAIAAEGPTRLTWEIEPRDGGLSRLRVSHATQDAPRAAAIVSGSRPEAGGGWPYILGDLKALLETGKPAAPRASGGPDAVDA